MRCKIQKTDKPMPRWKLWFHLSVSSTVIVLSCMLFLYPAATIAFLIVDSKLSETGQSRLVPHWFRSATPRFISWADMYLETGYGGSIQSDDIPATEWPMFGATFYLLAVEELQRDGRIDPKQSDIHEAIEKAAKIVASPTTGTWVKKKWGGEYLKRENVFYRMLLILGLSSYEHITGNRQHRAIMSHQRAALADELAKAKFNLRDDYPGECYPADMLWAVAAIRRAEKLEGVEHGSLADALMASFDGPIKAAEGLPAFQADSRTGRIQQGARGCGNSGLLVFAYELDPTIAARWYDAYDKRFWKDTGWIAGFTEMPLDAKDRFADVDSGPVLDGVGSVASAFGIGAARTAGRMDHAAPLTLQTVACSWPTPFGFLVPGVLGRIAAKSWSLGETALLFSMTRPNLTAQTIPFQGRVPYIVWLCLVVYGGVGVFFVWFEIRSLRRLFRKKSQAAT